MTAWRPTRRRFAKALTGISAVACTKVSSASSVLDEGFRNPTDSAKPWAYWGWLNGYVTREGIVRDLDEMKRQGIAGVLVFNAGGGPTPKTIAFMSPEWRELFRFTTQAANKRGITVSLNLCSGWNAGGPWVEVEDAAQTIVFSEARVRGPRIFEESLAVPSHRDEYYRDVAVLAYPSAGSEVWRSDSMLDLSPKMDRSGHLRWDVPEGEWLILRLGHTVAPRGRTKSFGGADGGYEIDPFRPETMGAHFAATAGKVLADGSSFKAVSIDSWEMGRPDWTPGLRKEFRRRRGYDLTRFLGALAGKTLDSPEVTARFREDFDRTLGDLTAENYYGRLAELAHKRGLLTHCEAAGYQKPCVDSLQAMGRSDMTMGEFWARTTQPDGYIHQATQAQLRFHDSIKLASSAAHIYGRQLVMAEAFTVNRPDWVHWNQYPFALKDIGDRAFCQGLNRNVLCCYVHQPELDHPPGYQPGCGTNFDRFITWWPKIHGWLKYLARCQYLLQQGRFVADVCYFYGETVPNYVPAKDSMDPPLPRGFDCDTINAEVLINHLRVEDGRLVLPDGISYRCLVLPLRAWAPPLAEIFCSPGNGLPLAMSPAIIRKIRELTEAGATVLGPRPSRAPGLQSHHKSDAEVKKLTEALWGNGPSGQRKIGKGRVIWGRTLDEIFSAEHVLPDFEIRGGDKETRFDFIHRRDKGTEIYFISNQRNRPEKVECLFRVTGEQPELWDPVTGEISKLPEFRFQDGRTAVTMEFAPRQSYFVILREAVSAASAGLSNFPKLEALLTLEGPWQVSFDPKWGGPGTVTFEHLEDWIRRPEEGVRHYSGTATYRRSFECPEAKPGGRFFLDLGVVNYVAEVRLNGRNLGVVWTAPWRVEITSALQAKGNLLEIDVVNLWPNRLIGDADLLPEKRLTKTNVTKFKSGDALLSSGLLGPVVIRRIRSRRITRSEG